MLIHVDDTLTASNSLEGGMPGERVLSEKYKVQDMRELKDLFGPCVERDHANRSLFLSAPRLTIALLEGST